jgi:hypothetical protein
MLDPEHTNYDSLRYIKVSTQRDTESIGRVPGTCTILKRVYGVFSLNQAQER